MMKFHKLRDFMELVPVCPHCKLPMVTLLQNNKVPDTSAGYDMDFAGTTFVNPMTRAAKKLLNKIDGKPLSYTSDFIDPFLVFYYEIEGGARHKIISINVDTNEISEDLDKAQRIIWNFELSVVRGCKNNDCLNNKTIYYADTSNLVIERKTNTVYPCFLKSEACSAFFNNKLHALLSLHELNKTEVTVEEGAFLTSITVIKELPLISLHKLKNGNVIINKIKTLVVFS